MAFEERSYSGKLLRPTPEVFVEEDGSFGVVATSWGSRQIARRVIDILTDYVQSARQDLEATSPFQKLTCLSPLANSLRAGVMLANDVIYREENKNEYLSGVELVVFSHIEGELAFAQVGYPHLFLARQGLPWIPLSVQMDLALEYTQGGADVLPPMPQNMIGLHTATNMNLNSFKAQQSDKLIFLSHSVASSPLYNLPFEKTNLDKVSESLSKAHPDLPFWLGILSY